jgi:hypothetical protein
MTPINCEIFLSFEELTLHVQSRNTVNEPQNNVRFHKRLLMRWVSSCHSSADFPIIQFILHPSGHLEVSSWNDCMNWIMLSSGMIFLVALVRTEVSEEKVASIIRVTRIGEPGTTLVVASNRSTLRSDTFLRNVGSYENHMAQHRRNQHFS